MVWLAKKYAPIIYLIYYFTHLSKLKTPIYRANRYRSMDGPRLKKSFALTKIPISVFILSTLEFKL